MAESRKLRFSTNLKTPRGRKVPSLEGFFSVLTTRTSSDDGWQVLKDIVMDQKGLLRATDEAIFDANFQLAGLVKAEMEKRIESGKGFRPLSPLTSVIERSRRRFSGRSDLELKGATVKNRKPMFRTGQLKRSLTISRTGTGRSGAVAVGFPASKRRGTDLTNADVANMIEKGYSITIPPSTGGLEDIGFPVSISDQEGGIRGFMRILGIIGTQFGRQGSMPFPPRAGITYKVPGRKIRFPTVQSLTSLGSPQSRLAGQIYISAFLSSVIKRGFGGGSQSSATRNTLDALEALNRASRSRGKWNFDQSKKVF